MPSHLPEVCWTTRRSSSTAAESKLSARGAGSPVRRRPSASPATAGSPSPDSSTPTSTGHPDSPTVHGVPDRPLECWLVALIGLPPLRLLCRWPARSPEQDWRRPASRRDPSRHSARPSRTRELRRQSPRHTLRGYAKVGVGVVLAAASPRSGLPVSPDRDRILAHLPDLQASSRDRWWQALAEAALEVIDGVRDSIIRGELGDVLHCAPRPTRPTLRAATNFSACHAGVGGVERARNEAHVLETRYRGESSATAPTRRWNGGGLQRSGLLDRRLLAAHCVRMNAADREDPGPGRHERRHDPGSNLRLPPASHLSRAASIGVNVGTRHGRHGARGRRRDPGRTAALSLQRLRMSATQALTSRRPWICDVAAAERSSRPRHRCARAPARWRTSSSST